MNSVEFSQVPDEDNGTVSTDTLYIIISTAVTVLNVDEQVFCELDILSFALAMPTF